ncbi:Asp23/Gls24 family envelope stress response protein [Arthrobacter sp. PAMC25284]|nr:Asp23/Gls24 family envelope stress response protein [Arthrobacter sp. PAMC25284]
MAEQQSPSGSSGGVVAASSGQADTPAPAKKMDALHTDRGDTTIEEGVVQKLAGMATREVPGVFAMGSAGRRAFSALAERIPGSQTNVSGGVSVEKGERQTAIDVSIVVEYGISIVEISNNIRRNVIQSVEHATGLEVLEVNIHVTDVHLPGDESAPDEPKPDRLQ